MSKKQIDEGHIREELGELRGTMKAFQNEFHEFRSEWKSTFNNFNNKIDILENQTVKNTSYIKEIKRNKERDLTKLGIYSGIIAAVISLMIKLWGR